MRTSARTRRYHLHDGYARGAHRRLHHRARGVCDARLQNVGKGGGFAFASLAGVFEHMAGGAFFGVLFYMLLLFAALTSSISLIEGVVAFLTERFGWKRKPTTIIVCTLMFLLGCHVHHARRPRSTSRASGSTSRTVVSHPHLRRLHGVPHRPSDDPCVRARRACLFRRLGLEARRTPCARSSWTASRSSWQRSTACWSSTLRPSPSCSSSWRASSPARR